ncbi:MAG: choline dehydrogenase-like flavoprotein [Candidatus Azotimanducaceae bacterium]
MSHPPVDVLIIGAGASAAAFAWSLVDTKMEILCLEQGGWLNPSEYPSSTMDWESNNAFNSNPNHRANAADYPINDSESPISVANYNGVGGGTILFAGHYPRLHPSDFRVRTLDGVADDWPLDYKTLEPFYDENDRMMGVSGLAGDPAYPPKKAMMPPIPLGLTGEVLARGFNQLGWHWWPSDMAIATEQYDGRDKCINLGACGNGCAQGAKASTDITYWPHAIRAGVKLKTGCRVREITVDESGMATGAVYYDEEGKEQYQPAAMVVMACNGIGTPRILLNSTSVSFPDGLANSSGMVGKNLMFHPYAAVEGVFDDAMDGAKGPHKCVACHEFYETDKERDFVRGFSFETQRGYGPVATALRGVFTGKIPKGAGHHEAYEKLNERIVGLVAVCEDLPEEHNRVTLDPELKDAHGIAAPKIHYTLSENSAKMLDFAVARGTEALEAAGARDVIKQRLIGNAGWHNMGTARMGTNPKTSVVNEWGRCHDVKNLFIIDGSIFVTSGGVNPTRTIQALALYIADKIKQKLVTATLFD